MRGVGEGEKSINCIDQYDVTGPLVTSWLLKKFSPNRLEAGILLSHNNMSTLGRQKS
jgi:hypothetical protein